MSDKFEDATDTIGSSKDQSAIAASTCATEVCSATAASESPL